jgi:hypothetical protein
MFLRKGGKLIVTKQQAPIPVYFLTKDGKKPTEEQVKKLAELIKEGYKGKDLKFVQSKRNGKKENV